jgi:predicted Rossmann fold nucleotide-binding protein DprA/Smf involved in DNA uptake
VLTQRDLIAVALTSRLVPSAVPPLSATEFWSLSRSDVFPTLHGRSACEIARELAVPGATAERMARLLDRGTALALALERVEHAGVWTITGVGDAYPDALRARLGDSAPAVLHGVGDARLLGADGVGVVGSRDVDDAGADVARRVARVAVGCSLPVVSGAARGVDQHAMNAALEFGGQVVGVLADSLVRSVARPSVRKGVSAGSICLVTPYGPTAPFSAGNAMGRNKIIYALSRCVVVVRSDEGSGGTWAGAREALRQQPGVVIAWVGAGSAPGNRALVELGAAELSATDQLIGLIQQARPESAQDVAPRPRQPVLF